MLIDSHNVLWDGDLAVKAGDLEVGLTSLLHPGLAEPIPIVVRSTAKPSGASAVVVKLEQADKQGGSYTAVPGAEYTFADDNALKPGMGVAWRFVPKSVLKPWIRLNVSGTVGTGGKLFAMVCREDAIPYSKGMYIDKGVVEG